MANLPGILGFYPRESVVFTAFESTAEPNRFRLGPVLRIDLADLDLLPEVGKSLAGIGTDLVFTFVITAGDRAATEEAVNRLFAASESGSVDIAACWHTREILTGQPYQLAFGPAREELAVSLDQPHTWEEGEISSVVDAPAMGPLLKTGNLPELHRSEAFDYYNRFNPRFEPDEIIALESFAARHATDLVHRIEQEVGRGDGETISGVLADCDYLLAEIADTEHSVAELMADEEMLVTVAVYLSDSLLRDAIMGLAPRYRQATMDLALAVARTFGGTVRANALCLHAIAAVAADLSMRVVPALTAALRAAPGHTLSSLLLDGAQHGVFRPMLEAAVRGSEIVAQRYHASFRQGSTFGPAGFDSVDAA